MEIGVLALQGNFDDHISALQALEVKATQVENRRQPPAASAVNGHTSRAQRLRSSNRFI